MRCKPGDLAIVKRSACGNEGKVVEVVEWRDAFGYVFEDGRWNSLAGWVCHGDSIRSIDAAGRHEVRKVGVFPDEWLMPIRPDAEPESTTTPRELEAA